jgi:hypothetical protein
VKQEDLAELDRIFERLEIQATTLRVLAEELERLTRNLDDKEEELNA